MWGDRDLVRGDYRRQWEVVRRLAEFAREKNPSLWQDYAAGLHEILLRRNQIVGACLWQLRDFGDQVVAPDFLTPLNLRDEEESLLAAIEFINSGDPRPYELLQRVRATNRWWRTSNLRLLISSRYEAPAPFGTAARRAFQLLTFRNMFLKCPDVLGLEETREFASALPIEQGLAYEFGAPEVFLNEEREDALIATFRPDQAAVDKSRRAAELEDAAEDIEEGSEEHGATGLPEEAAERISEAEEVAAEEAAIEASDEATSNSMGGLDTVRRTPHMHLGTTVPIAPGTEFIVEIFADEGEPLPGEAGEPILIASSSEVDLYLDVWLVTSAHFEVTQRPMDKLHIERRVTASNRVPFALRAKSLDELRAIKDELPALNKGSITAAFAYRGCPCGRVGRVVDLDVADADADADAEVDHKTPSRLEQGRANRAKVPQPRTGIVVEPADEYPHMCVQILEEDVGDGRHFHCRVITSLEDTAGPWSLKDTTARIVGGYMANFTKKGKSQKQLIAALRGAGIKLFGAAPKNFREAFWRLIDAGCPPRTIRIVTDEPHFLWELMVPTRGGKRRDPLGVEFIVGRWVTGDATSPIRQLPITDSYVIAPAYEGRRKLPHAEDEAELICTMFNGEKINPASYDNILEQFAAKQVSLLHFACHGRSSDETLEQVLELTDQGELTTTELEGEDVFRSYFSSKRPLVFLNACEVGRQQAALTGAGGFPAALIGLGAGAVIAPVWSVKDDIAHKIALDFYRRLKADRRSPLAAIFREIREQAYQKGEDTYAAYCFYGDPLARLWTAPEPAEPQPVRG